MLGCVRVPAHVDMRCKNGQKVIICGWLLLRQGHSARSQLISPLFRDISARTVSPPTNCLDYISHYMDSKGSDGAAPLLVSKPLHRIRANRQVTTPAGQQAVGRVTLLTFAIDQEPYHLASALWKNASYTHQAAHFPVGRYRAGDQGC